MTCVLRSDLRQHAGVDFTARQYIFYFLPLRQALDFHPIRRLPPRDLFLLIGPNSQRSRRHAIFFLQNAAHPERYRVEVSAHADNFTGKVFGLSNTARGIDEHVAVTKFTVREHGDPAEWRAAGCPTEKHAHLELAHVELQIARKSPVALFRRHRDDG